MAQTLALTTATVKYTPGQPRETQYGLRINTVLTLQDGTETKLWGNPDDTALLALRKGQSVQLAKNQKGQWQLLQQDESTATTGSNTKQNQPSWEPEDREATATKIEHRAKVFRYCLIKAKEHCGDLVESEESIRAIATSLFIEVLKR